MHICDTASGELYIPMRIRKSSTPWFYDEPENMGDPSCAMDPPLQEYM